MSKIKGFLFAVTGLFIMVTLVSLLIPSKVTVTRGEVVNASGARVFSEIANIRHWQNWQPVFKETPVKLSFSNDSTVAGSYCQWEGRGRKNKLQFISVTENQVTVSLTSTGDNEVINTISVLPLADSSRVQVEWRAVTKLNWYPWEKFYGIFVEKLTGSGYETILKSLKTYVEGL